MATTNLFGDGVANGGSFSGLPGYDERSGLPAGGGKVTPCFEVLVLMPILFRLVPSARILWLNDIGEPFIVPLDCVHNVIKKLECRFFLGAGVS
jgi:hypothetical protein